jgi:hypothetical protein
MDIHIVKSLKTQLPSLMKIRFYKFEEDISHQNLHLAQQQDMVILQLAMAAYKFLWKKHSDRMN